MEPTKDVRQNPCDAYCKKDPSDASQNFGRSPQPTGNRGGYNPAKNKLTHAKKMRPPHTPCPPPVPPLFSYKIQVSLPQTLPNKFSFIPFPPTNRAHHPS